MPKLKTKSGAKKRFSMTATGKIKMGAAFRRHNLRKRPQTMKTASRGTTLVHESDVRTVKRFMPYA